MTSAVQGSARSASAHLPAVSTYSMPGQCRECKRRREVFSCSRKNGGNYRIASRWRRSSICAECATNDLHHTDADHTDTDWSTNTVRSIVASLDTDEAREALAVFDARVAARKARKDAEDIRMRPYWDRIAERREAIDWVRSQQYVDGMDVTTCQAIAGGIKRGEAGHESTGAIRTSGEDLRWERTMREQVLDYINAPTDSDLDADTLTALARGIRAGLHRAPAEPYVPPKIQDLP